MCGIAGIVGLQCDSATAEKILRTMSHRGPDGRGIYQNEACTLLHTRLAIIDPEGGRQPMALQWGQERYIITYNGELYNASELRSQLTVLGHDFLGHSDTEVLLHAYAQWGADCLEKLNGIYAFGIWEEKNRRLFLARDRMGVKPLFYMSRDHGVLFASEIKSLLAYPQTRAQLDGEGVAQILLLGPGRIPGSGVFRNVFSLEPGCCGYWTGKDLKVRRYWRLLDREHTQTLEETVETVRSLILNAIRRQMVSDVPVGTFLSGGLDSSIISSICASAMSETGERLHTFSVDYENNNRYFVPDKFQPAADASYIQIMQRYLNSRHTDVRLTAKDLVYALDTATVARDLPGMADVDFSLLAFCGHIRKDVKVALSGECADEIFGGYPWYRDPEIRSFAGFPWAQNTACRASFLHPAYRENTDPEAFVQDLYHRTISETDILPGTDPLERRMKEMVTLNQRWFMQTLLDRKDRMSMHHGLEVRVPFCDHRIAEYLYGVPWKFKDYNGQEKGLLRMAMDGVLPQEVLWRKKSPYPKTWDPAYLTMVTDRLKAVIADPQAPIHQVVSNDALTALIHTDFTWPWYGQLMKLPQTIAYFLQIDFWLRHYQVQLV